MKGQRQLPKMPREHRIKDPGSGGCSRARNVALRGTWRRRAVAPKMPVLRLLPQGVPGRRQAEPLHPAMTLADLDGDGKLDILTAVMSENGGAETASLEAFYNRGR